MALKQLSDGGPDGWGLGQSANDKGSFYGAPAVVQPSGNAQAALARGQQAGVIGTFSTTQSPSAVTANTCGESSFTVQTGTGGQFLPAAGDVLYVNKPTSQAGLGMGNARVASSNTIGVNFSNFTAGSITPTASEVYKVVALRGQPTIAQTLSPAAVPAATIAEQQFTVVGLPAGALVQVSKPTAQAGLDIVGCRVVSNNVLGITFANPTASPITPTAAESYTVNVLLGLDAINNDVLYGFNVGTVGAIGGGIVISGGSTTLTGVLATDLVTGIQKPTSGAAATNAAFPALAVPTANTLTLYFAGIGTGATPTANEVYGIRTARLNPVAPLLNYSQSLAPVSVAANTTAEQTFNVTGLVAGSPVWVNKPSAQPGLGIVGVRVSAAGTLAITYANVTANAIVPATETYVIGNFQLPAPGAGNVVMQSVASDSTNATVTNAIRNALVSTGVMAGA